MKTITISLFLEELKVWHKIKGKAICTRRLCIRIPKMDNKVAYFAGVITGDGSITMCKRKKGGYHYRVQVSGYKKYLAHLAKLVNNLFNYKPKIRKDERKRNCYSLDIYSAVIFAYFVKLGPPVGKKRRVSVPQIINNNSTLFKHYLLGLIDTDGYVENRRVQLKQRDKGFLKELVKLLNKHFGTIANPPKVNYTEGKPYFYIRFPINQLLPLVRAKNEKVGEHSIIPIS